MLLNSRLYRPKPLIITTTAVFALTGQSNMVGRLGPIEAGVGQLDEPQSNILMFSNGSLVTASDPLDHFDELAGSVGMGLTLAKEYLLDNPSLERVILVPAADGGTGFLAENWNRIDTLYNDAVTRVNDAMVLAKSTYGDLTTELVAIVDAQGEDELDGNEGGVASDKEMRGWKTRFFIDIRNDITEATQTTPVISCGLAPNWTELPADINPMFSGLGSFVENYGYADPSVPTVLASADTNNIHYTAASMRAFAPRVLSALSTAKNSATVLASLPARPSGDLGIHFDCTGLPDGYPIIENSGNDIRWSGRRVFTENGEIQFQDGTLSRRMFIEEDSRHVLVGQDFSIRTAVTFNDDQSPSGTGSQGIVGNWLFNDNERSWLLRTFNDDIQFFWSNTGTGSTGSIASTNAFTIGTEVEIEIRREAGTISMFIDGSVSAADSDSISGSFFQNGQGITIGDYSKRYDQGGGGLQLGGSIRYLTIENL